MLQDFWLPCDFIPREIRPDVYAAKITIPGHCPHCGTELVLEIVGSEKEGSKFKQACDHFGCYNQTWNERITEENMPEFGVCTHCGEINLFQVGKYLCYLCRTNPYR